MTKMKVLPSTPCDAPQHEGVTINIHMPPPQYELEQDGKPLQVFFFTVQDGPVAVEIKEDVHVSLAYDDAGAIEALKKGYPQLRPEQKKIVRKRGQVPVDQILRVINLAGTPVPVRPKQETSFRTRKEIKEKDFLYGLMLAADKYIEGDRDRATIKRITQKALKKYESRTPTTATA